MSTTSSAVAKTLPVQFSGVLFFDRLVEFFSAEWLLKNRANGGTVIITRTLIITLEIVIIAAFLDDLTNSHTKFALQVDWVYLIAFFHKNLAWFGAVAGFVYLSLYARFSSQWTYVANLYNQIVATSAADGKEEIIKRWWAGFIEDCWTMHLARKPMFAHCINGLLEAAEASSPKSQYDLLVKSDLIASLGDHEYHRLRDAVKVARERQKKALGF